MADGAPGEDIDDVEADGIVGLEEADITPWPWCPRPRSASNRSAQADPALPRWKLKNTNLPRNGDNPVLRLIATDGSSSAFTATPFLLSPVESFTAALALGPARGFVDGGEEGRGGGCCGHRGFLPGGGG